jgi:hypothetical protein
MQLSHIDLLILGMVQSLNESMADVSVYECVPGSTKDQCVIEMG